MRSCCLHYKRSSSLQGIKASTMVSVYSPISPVEGQSLSQSHSGAMSIPLRRPEIHICEPSQCHLPSWAMPWCIHGCSRHGHAVTHGSHAATACGSVQAAHMVAACAGAPPDGKGERLASMHMENCLQRLCLLVHLQRCSTTRSQQAASASEHFGQ